MKASNNKTCRNSLEFCLKQLNKVLSWLEKSMKFPISSIKVSAQVTLSVKNVDMNQTEEICFKIFNFQLKMSLEPVL